MNITGSTLSADAVRAYLHSKKAEEEAKQRAFEASTKIELDKLQNLLHAEGKRKHVVAIVGPAGDVEKEDEVNAHLSDGEHH